MQVAKIRSALQDRWKGAYHVTGIISEKTIICLVNGKEQPTAYNNLKPYYAMERRKLREKISG